MSICLSCRVDRVIPMISPRSYPCLPCQPRVSKLGGFERIIMYGFEAGHSNGHGARYLNGYESRYLDGFEGLKPSGSNQRGARLPPL